MTSCVNNAPPNLTFKTKNSLSTFDFKKGSIIKFIKAHQGLNDMVEDLSSWLNYESFQYQNLHILFKKCLEKECFPSEWKKANIASPYKKGDM